MDKIAIETLAEKLAKPQIVNLIEAGEAGKDYLPAALVPDGFDLKSVKFLADQYKTKPERRQGTIRALDAESFVKLANRFKNAESVIFSRGDITDTGFVAQLRAVLNYHPQGGDNANADNGDHVVQYDFPLSDELKLWLQHNKTPFNQKEFAEFLEDNIADLVAFDEKICVTNFGANGTPAFATPSAIMSLARGIDVRVDEKVTQAYRTSTGEFALQYTSENKDSVGQPLKLPEWFALGIPVFRDGKAWQIIVRLRFRVKEGAVTWFYELYRKRDVLNAAFTEICDDAERDTALPLYNGTDR